MKEETKKQLEAHILEKHSVRAIYGYVRLIKQYINYTGEASAKAAVYSQIVDYMGVLRKQGVIPRTLLNHLYAIKMYYQWLVDSGQRDDHPCRDFYLKDKINKAIQVENLYTKKELDEILNTYIGRTPLMRRRDTVVLSLVVNQAITNTELLELKISDIDFKKGVLHLPGCVKTQARVLPLKPEQIMLFSNYIKYCRPLFLQRNTKEAKEDKDILILSREGKKMCPTSLCGIFRLPLSNGQKITLQKIRQSAIAHLLKTGKDLRVVQAFTGHKNVSSVEEYRQTGLEEMKNLIQKLHPLQ